MRVRTLLGLCAVFLAAAACEKDKDFVNATVRDAGNVSQGGCGYLLNVDGVGEQRPDYLPSAYQHEGMRVKIRYHLSGNYDTCRNASANQFFEIINLDEVKRAL